MLRNWVVAGLCAVSLYSARAWCDTVWLKNGDRISGTVSKIADGKVTVSTAFAGDVAIGLDHVQGIATENPLAVQRADGTIEIGALTYEDDVQTIVGAETAEPAPVESLKRAAPDRDALDKAIRKANRIWSGSVDTAATIRSGETDRYDATLGIELQRKRPEHTLTLKLNGHYGETDDELNAQKLYGEAKWQYYFSAYPLYAFVVSTGEHDKLRRLQSRYTAGAGLGYTFIERPRVKLSGEVGLIYSWERWENFAIGERRDLVTAAREMAYNDFLRLLMGVNAGDIAVEPRTLLRGLRIVRDFGDPDVGDEIRTEEYPSARIAVSYSQKFWKASTLTDDLVILPELDDVGEFRLTNTLAFMTPVAENLDFRASLRTEYDSDPGAEDVDKFDNILTLGLRYSF